MHERFEIQTKGFSFEKVLHCIISEQPFTKLFPKVVEFLIRLNDTKIIF